MEITNEAAQLYAEKYTSPEDSLLKEVFEFTINNHPKHHMISGLLQGKFLEMISSMIKPGKILEIGTFTGYSALCLAKGLTTTGTLHTIEQREEEAINAKRFFDRSFFRDKIILHIGNALEIVGEINESWDLVFIDADKENYINYFNLVFPKVKQNGFILADNVLFYGEVLQPGIKGKAAKAIQAFNDYLLTRNDVERLILPFRDGLMLLRKI